MGHRVVAIVQVTLTVHQIVGTVTIQKAKAIMKIVLQKLPRLKAPPAKVRRVAPAVSRACQGFARLRAAIATTHKRKTTTRVVPMGVMPLRQ